MSAYELFAGIIKPNEKQIGFGGSGHWSHGFYNAEIGVSFDQFYCGKSADVI